LSSDEDLLKSVCGTDTRAFTLLVTVVCVTGSHKTENCYRGFG
jgi:hypothetical protein